MIESAEEFVRLRTSTIQPEYWRAAHDSAPDAVWLAVIERYPEMREWVSVNKTVPIHILNGFLTDPDLRVRSSVVRINRLSSEMLAILASDPDETVRGDVCDHRHTSLEILQQLSIDPSRWVSEKARARLQRGQ